MIILEHPEHGRHIPASKEEEEKLIEEFGWKRPATPEIRHKFTPRRPRKKNDKQLP
jgi:hypothetical protein